MLQYKAVTVPSHKWIAGRTAAAIARSIEEGIHRGRTTQGDPLPPVRELADLLRVSPTTVAAAYKTLRQRGFVAGHRRRGTLVSRSAVTRPEGARPAQRQWPGAGDVVDLANGNPDPALLPPLDAALRTIDSTHRLYDTEPLVAPLVAFAAGDFDADGVDARFIAVVSGALDGIERTLREHLRPGDRVAVEDPCFPGLVHLLHAAAFLVIPFGVDEEGPVPEQLEAALRQRCQAVIVTPRAQNPTGAAVSDRRAGDLLRVLRGFPDVVLVENDDAAAIAGAPSITLTSSVQRWSVVRSTSKFLGPDLRVAVMAGDELTIARVRGRQALGARWVSGILQQLALAMWSDPSSGRRLARAAEIYAQRRAALIGALATRGVAAHGRSGFNVWVPVKEESRVTDALTQRGWAVAPGERFRIASPPGVRITTAALVPPHTDRLADALADVLAAPTGGSA
jgi:DNA-binding transcriptional MocR family regulator